jgi:hypothetical protein
MRSSGDFDKTPNGYGTRRAIDSPSSEILSKSDRLSVGIGTLAPSPHMPFWSPRRVRRFRGSTRRFTKARILNKAFGAVSELHYCHLPDSIPVTRARSNFLHTLRFNPQPGVIGERNMAMVVGAWPKEAGNAEVAPKGKRWAPANLVFGFDRVLRRLQGIFEYSQSGRCIFRAQFGCARHTYAVSGTPQRGDRIVTLHFWNEQVPVFPQRGATIGWALDMHRAIKVSLCELARYLSCYRELDDISAIRLVIPVGTFEQIDQLRRIMAGHGFVALPVGPAAWHERVRWFVENIYVTLLVLAQNPGALRRDTLRRHRVEVFLLRDVLDHRYGVHSRKQARTEPHQQ